MCMCADTNIPRQLGEKKELRCENNYTTHSFKNTPLHARIYIHIFKLKFK